MSRKARRKAARRKQKVRARAEAEARPPMQRGKFGPKVAVVKVWAPLVWNRWK